MRQVELNMGSLLPPSSLWHNPPAKGLIFSLLSSQTDKESVFQGYFAFHWSAVSLYTAAQGVSSRHLHLTVCNQTNSPECSLPIT